MPVTLLCDLTLSIKDWSALLRATVFMWAYGLTNVHEWMNIHLLSTNQRDMKSQQAWVTPCNEGQAQSPSADTGMGAAREL